MQSRYLFNGVGIDPSLFAEYKYELENLRQEATDAFGVLDDALKTDTLDNDRKATAQQVVFCN